MYYDNTCHLLPPRKRRGFEELVFSCHFVWFYLEASANQTNRTRQNETRRKDESRRIKMNRTLQDESRRIKMNRTLQDESRRIGLATVAVGVPAFGQNQGKCAQIRTNLHLIRCPRRPGAKPQRIVMLWKEQLKHYGTHGAYIGIR